MVRNFCKKGYVPWNKGKKLSEEHRQKVIRGLIGRPVSKETRAKMSKILKGKTLDEEARLKFRNKFKEKGKRVCKNCEYCGVYFERARSKVKNHSFCSKNCNALWMKHIRKTEDHPLYRGIGDKNAKLYRQRSKVNNPNHYQSKRDNNVVFRIRRRGLGGNITQSEWLDMKEKAKFTCNVCGKEEPEIKLVADHIIPVVRWEEWVKSNNVSYRCGDKENIQPLCVSCNCKKSYKLPDDYGDKDNLEKKTQKELGY